VTAPTQEPPVVAEDRLSAAQIALIIALVDTQARMRFQLTEAAVKAAVAAFKAIGDWWSSAAVNAAIGRALRVIQPNQRQLARITDAYLARVASVLAGRRVAPAGAVDIERLRRSIPPAVLRELVDGDLRPEILLLGEHDPDRRRVNAGPDLDRDLNLVLPQPRQRDRALWLAPADAYGRVADQFRFGVVANGDTEDGARAKALVRVEAVARTDMTLAMREQVRRTLGNIRGVTGYRRILRPELSETGPCGLCVVAADRVYKSEHLMPLHDRCVCDVLPVVGEFDPGLNLNASDLRRVYEAAGGTGGEVRGRDGRRHSAALKKLRVALAEHGELGPVLFDADQHFRGPLDVARATHPDRRVRDLAKLAAFEERLDILLARQGRGEQRLERAIEWQTERVEKLRRELGRLRVAA
jgi:hypothetical protein